MTAASPAARSRVLVAVRTADRAAPVVSLASALLSGLDAELSGLFVEDHALLRVAALPITREVGLSSASVRPLELPDVERTLQRQAAQVRAAVEALARELSLPWSFRVARGTLIEEALAAMADLTLIGPVPTIAARTAAAATLPSRRRILVFDGEPGSSALETAARLAAHAGKTVTVERTSRDFEPAKLREGRTLFAVVMSASAAREGGAGLRRLLEAVGCPVVLVK